MMTARATHAQRPSLGAFWLLVAVMAAPRENGPALRSLYLPGMPGAREVVMAGRTRVVVRNVREEQCRNVRRERSRGVCTGEKDGGRSGEEAGRMDMRAGRS